MSATSPCIVFLDVDGVLHPLHRHLPRDASLADLSARVDEDLARGDIEPDYVGGVVTGEFERECMANLRDLVARVPGCRLVLSSSWRETPYQARAVRDQLKIFSVFAENEEFLGCTPHLGRGGTDRRGEEIMAWLRDNSLLHCSWVALDDAPLALPGAKFVQIDPLVGLSSENVNEALDKLNASGSGIH
jgi:hypothetical protein